MKEEMAKMISKKSRLTNKQLRSGNQAVAQAAVCCRPHVVSVYPITPQTTLLHEIARLISQNSLPIDFLNMESDQSAIAGAIGSSLVGTRVFTASNSQGLAYMNEHLFYASGLRLPIVMAVVNRALSSPHCRWPDHNDALSQSNTGWIQIFCENIQEAVDMCIQLFRICEDERVLLPAMFSYEAFVHSHTWEPIYIPEQAMVDKFLGERQKRAKLRPILDPDNPLTFNPATSPDYYMDFKFRVHNDMRNALDVIKEVGRHFGEMFGRDYSKPIDMYRCENAEVVVVTMGSIASTIREAIDSLQREGKQVGLVKMRVFRPFPKQDLQKVLVDKKSVIVLDRNSSPGADGALYTEIRSALAKNEKIPAICGVIVGLGGKDVSIGNMREIIIKAMERPQWFTHQNGSIWYGIKE